MQPASPALYSVIPAKEDVKVSDFTDFAGPDLIRRRRSLGIARPVAAERQANLTLGGGVSNL
jgi:hypothetical protein